MKKSIMIFERGLDQAISSYSHSQKQFIKQIASRLATYGYPIDQITSVEIGPSNNNITFVLSPIVIHQNTKLPPTTCIYFTWLPTKDNDYELKLTNFNSTYGSPEKNQDEVLTLIHQAFIENKSKSLPLFFTKGLKELSNTFYIVIGKKETASELIYNIHLLTDYKLTTRYSPPQKNVGNEKHLNFHFMFNLKSGELKMYNYAEVPRSNKELIKIFPELTYRPSEFN